MLQIFLDSLERPEDRNRGENGTVEVTFSETSCADASPTTDTSRQHNPWVFAIAKHRSTTCWNDESFDV